MQHPKFSILIATVGRREEKLKRLLKVLMPQVEKYKGQIEVVLYWNNGELPIGKIRQKLLEDSTGDYVCFVDDDDMVPEYYCEEIMNNLGKDYVGFRVKLFNDGKEKPPVYHSIKHTHWHNDDDGYYRDVTHLNPIRRDIALRGDFSVSTKEGEDFNWSMMVSPFVRDENYIDRDMYFYYHESLDTSFGTVDIVDKKDRFRPTFTYKYLRYHPNSTTKKKGQVR